MTEAEVAAVRRGLRTALERPSRAGIPYSQTNGAPIARTTGRLMRALMTHMPIMTNKMPMPTLAAAPPLVPRIDPAMKTAPTSVSTPPMTARIRSDRSGTVTPSRIAAMGGIRDARNDGNHAASNVTSTPTM